MKNSYVLPLILAAVLASGVSKAAEKTFSDLPDGGSLTTGDILPVMRAGVTSKTTYTFPASGLVVSTGTGWSSSVVNNSTNWNTAYGWGDHASVGY